MKLPRSFKEYKKLITFNYFRYQGQVTYLHKTFHVYFPIIISSVIYIIYKSHHTFHLPFMKKEVSKNLISDTEINRRFNSLDRINWQEDNNDIDGIDASLWLATKKFYSSERGTTYKVHLFDFSQTFFTELNKCV